MVDWLGRGDQNMLSIPDTVEGLGRSTGTEDGSKSTGGSWVAKRHPRNLGDLRTSIPPQGTTFTDLHGMGEDDEGSDSSDNSAKITGLDIALSHGAGTKEWKEKQQEARKIYEKVGRQPSSMQHELTRSVSCTRRLPDSGDKWS